MDDDFPEIKTGNGIDRDFAATANDRMKKTVIELKGMKKSVSDLNTNIISFHKSSDWYSKILIALTVLIVVLTLFLIIDAGKQSQSQDSLSLNSEFFAPTNTGIINAIENDKPILIENQGQYTDAQLDNYLGDFDDIENAYQEGLLNESDFCDSFSYYVQITDGNAEIQKYIAEVNKVDAGSDTSVADLAVIVSKSKNENCH